jgi:energy-coupling factor transporter ATP-binding protein EcfA2
MCEPVIQLEGLSRRFGQRTVLDAVTLELPRGKVYGLVGANGAGKTTLIRHVLGLLRAERGTVRVFGLDPVAEPVAVLSRVGYLSEDNDLPAWMRVGELIRYTRAFFPAWDEGYAKELCRALGLDASARIRDLSRGRRPGRGWSRRSRTVRSCSCSTSRRRASIQSSVATFSALCCARPRTRAARCSSPRTFSTKSRRSRRSRAFRNGWGGGPSGMRATRPRVTRRSQRR